MLVRRLSTYFVCLVSLLFAVGSRTTASTFDDNDFTSSGITIFPRASCASNSVDNRTIGYYQLSGYNGRACDTVSPSQISTSGLTHLYLAFAVFEPTNFTIAPSAETDLAIYSKFTALSSNSLEVWISIGGYTFSDPGTSTYYAWSNMTSSAANRATFIASLQNFLSAHNFNGADLDWEFPGITNRGGNSADTANFVSLVSEMRTAFNTTYGISVTIPSTASYVAEFDLKSMEASVDWFGFMAYDLASWSTETPFVAAQTDLRVIENSVQSLVGTGVDMSKVNMGLAMYGRGYTLSNTTCTFLGCPSTNASTPGNCTNSPGVLSLTEIDALIASQDLAPQFLSTASIMQLKYSTNQWLAYDDEYTFSLKKAYANSMCFGGTMAWSIDLNSGIGSIPNPAQTTGGTCGSIYDNTICGTYSQGSCCSQYGFCGGADATSSATYCGAGCQSGNCTMLPVIDATEYGSNTTSASPSTTTSSSLSSSPTATTSTSAAGRRMPDLAVWRGLAVTIFGIGVEVSL